MRNCMNNRAHAERWETRAAKFACNVWSIFPDGFVFLAAKDREAETWKEHPFKLPVSESTLARFLQEHPRERFDLYFCPNAFDKPVRKKHLAQPTPYAWVDIDDADPDAFVPPPGVLIKTSRRRYQGLWRFRDWRDVSEAEVYSKALAYKHDADRTGWSVTKYLRLPHTINHKPTRRKAEVKLLRADLSIAIRPPLLFDTNSLDVAGLPSIRVTIISPNDDWREVAAQYRRQLHPRVQSLIWTNRAYAFERDRSKCIFEIVAGLHGAGAHPDEIGLILFSNPYFRAKHGVNPQRAAAEVARVVAKLGGQNG